MAFPLKEMRRRVHSLLTMARKLAAGELSARTGLPYREDELGQLAKAVDEMAESLEDSPKQTELILNSLGNGVISMDTEGRVTYVNPAAAETLGFDISELVGQPLHSLIHHTQLNGEPYSENECPACSAIKDGAFRLQADEVFWKRDGSCIPVEYASTPIRHQGQLIGSVMVFWDLLQKIQMKEFNYLSHHDALTSLPNRRLFDDRLSQIILMSKRQKQPLVLLVFDLNGFKRVNDVYGHACGDLVLRLVSLRVSKAIRGSDTLARLGGDEFGIILPNTTLKGAEMVIRDVIKCFDEPMFIGGHAIQVGVSIGVALGNASVNSEGLERRADDAMYQAKRAKRGVSVSRTPRSSSEWAMEDPHYPNSRRQQVRAKRTYSS